MRHLGRLGQLFSAHDELHCLNLQAILRIVVVRRLDHKTGGGRRQSVRNVHAGREELVLLKQVKERTPNHFDHLAFSELGRPNVVAHVEAVVGAHRQLARRVTFLALTL